MKNGPYPAPADLEYDKDCDHVTPRFKSARHPVLTVCLAVIALLLCLLIGWVIPRAFDPYDNRILPNTTIGGIDVGNMTRSQASQFLKQSVSASLLNMPMEVILPEDTILLSPADTGIRFHARSAAADAYRLGRTGSEEEKQTALDISGANGNSLKLLPYLKIDQNAIRAQLEAYTAAHNTVHTELSYHLAGTAPALEEDRFDETIPGQTLELTLGTPLQELDVEAALTQILDAYSRNALSVTIAPAEKQTTPKAPDWDAIYREFYREPVNTSLDMSTCQQIPGKYGYAPDLEQAQQLYASARPGQTISIPMVAIEPEILGDAVYFQEELGYCETKHTNNEDRNTNLRLACAAIDGLILQPGEEFSYNGTLGQRTAEKGYKPAGAYSGTATVNAIGGGICQVSSTLYYATLIADMEIVFRANHGYKSSYIGVGLDATVNWGGPDFQFRNNSHFPIMIRAEVSDGMVKVRILGTDEKDYYVRMTSRYSEDDQFIYAWSYKSRYDKDTDELISTEKEAYSCYMK